MFVAKECVNLLLVMLSNFPQATTRNVEPKWSFTRVHTVLEINVLTAPNTVLRFIDRSIESKILMNFICGPIKMID